MRAVVFRQGDLVVENLAEPKPGSGLVLVRTLACGICGSDLHARDHASRMEGISKFVPWRKPLDPTRDVVMGHEFACEILDYGAGASKKIRVGAPVVSVPWIVREGAVQGIGFSNENTGGYAERMLLSEGNLLEVPNGLPAEQAALTEPLAVGIHAVEKARVSGDEVPLVVGCGPIGLAVVATLRAKKLHPIVAADFSPKRRELALLMGADVVVDPATVSPYKTWQEYAAMPPADSQKRAPLLGMPRPSKPALIFECVGVPGVINSIFEGAPRHARVIVVGVCMENDLAKPLLGILKELSVQYVFGFTKEEFASGLRMLAEGEVNAKEMVSGKVGLDEIGAAFADLANPERHTKILVEPWR
jgi:threonine dehydrogenase-like Zn-dependent dehydrogenase